MYKIWYFEKGQMIACYFHMQQTARKGHGCTKSSSN